LHSRTIGDAMDKVIELGVMPADVAKQYHELYKKTPGVNFLEAFNNFYKDVKTGNYMFEAEVDQMTKFIKENLLGENLDDYTEVLNKHDFYYDMSDDRRKAEIGREMERRMREIYKGLSEDEKRKAAVLYRDKLLKMNYRNGSKYNLMLKDWNPIINFNPESFDGVFYRV